MCATAPSGNYNVSVYFETYANRTSDKRQRRHDTRTHLNRQDFRTNKQAEGHDNTGFQPAGVRPTWPKVLHQCAQDFVVGHAGLGGRRDDFGGLLLCALQR